MKKLLKASLILMLTSLSCIAQNDLTGYPRKIVLENDTLCLFTIPQVKKINFICLKLDYFKELSDSLMKLDALYASIIDGQKKVIKADNERIALRDQMLDGQQKIGAYMEAAAKADKRRITSLKIQRGGLVAIVVILAVKAFVVR